MTAQLVPYRDDAVELPRLLAYLREIWRHPGSLFDFHPGDAVWQRFRAGSAGFDAALRVALWEEPGGADGRVVGFTWFDDPDEVVVNIHPDVLPTADAGDLLDRMLAWGEERRAIYAERGEPSDALLVSCLREDARTEHLLAERGFATDGEVAYQSNRRGLLDELPERPVADGYRLVDLTDEALIPERVAIHREVWNPSVVTEQGYREMRGQPLYDPELDLMAITEGGEAAAYALCWLDGPTKTAIFEPVGARGAHRRRGLSAAVLAEGMRRCRARGAETMYVLHSGDADAAPADALYRSVGFRPIGHFRYWRRPAGVPAA